MFSGRIAVVSRRWFYLAAYTYSVFNRRKRF